MEAGPRNRPRHEESDAHPAGRAGDGEFDGVTEPSDADEPDEPVDHGDPSSRGDGLEADPLHAEVPDERSFRELRPPLRLRIWQLIPIVAIGALGSLMFAFPLAFEFGDGGPVVAMLGLLLSCCAAGWAVMAARRVGYTWPGLPARGSGDRPDWRFVAGYTCFAALVALLAVWRVARLR